MIAGMLPPLRRTSRLPSQQTHIVRCFVVRAPAWNNDFVPFCNSVLFIWRELSSAEVRWLWKGFDGFYLNCYSTMCFYFHVFLRPVFYPHAHKPDAFVVLRIAIFIGSVSVHPWPHWAPLSFTSNVYTVPVCMCLFHSFFCTSLSLLSLFLLLLYLSITREVPEWDWLFSGFLPVP